VRLHLVALNGRAPAEVLAPYESELRALMPARLSAARPPMAALDTESSVVAGVENNEDKAHVRLPGLSIDAAGDRAQVRIGGAITIDADETDSVVKIRSNDGDGDVTVNADQSGAEVRASSGRDGDVRTTFMLATDATRPGDYQLVGYEARGPCRRPRPRRYDPLAQRAQRRRHGCDEGPRSQNHRQLSEAPTDQNVLLTLRRTARDGNTW
jgi:hypothetical protein